MNLLDHPFFTDLPAEHAEQLSARCTIGEVQAGETVFREGDPSDCICLVLEGLVTFYKQTPDGRERSVSQCSEGAFFGEVGVFTGAPRALSAVASDSVRLGFIHRDALVSFIRHTSGPVEQVLGSIVRHLHDTTRHYMEDILQQEKLSLVGTMMNSIIHDFKNPFTMISLGTQLMQKRYPDDPKLQKICNNIGDQIQRMLDMANELAEFSRGAATELKTTQVHLPKFFAGFHELNEPFFQSDRIDVTIECADLDLEAESNKLMRVLQNLTGNAVEAFGDTKSGHVKLTAAPDGDDWVVLTVEDNAGGIPEEIQATLFEPFVTFGKSRGTGLGTAIVKSIVDAHGGSIRFKSVQGQGTCFTIRLPRYQAKV